jgi:hypothetical protein
MALEGWFDLAEGRLGIIILQQQAKTAGFPAGGTACFDLSLRCLRFITPNPSSSQPVAKYDLEHWILLAQSCPHLLHH